ncbi:hypothetical protein ZIOFF_011650 [Zingiber officinale]|uniref:Transmembrane protein n=1 Tax=Zingiber officinale TaxID=94328 RepID=A0A8J5HYJ5_ZINOF|nr:hypothetical protein ZIOFF_011650 [Zingiber officinale]
MAASSAGDRCGESWTAVAINCCLLASGAAGGALLAWWAQSFHRSNRQLWMVPAGLVLVGTPVFAWLSLLASAVYSVLRTAAARPPSSPLPIDRDDPER